MKNLISFCQKIYQQAYPYYIQGREKDDIHHLVVLGMMQELLKEYDLDEEIMQASALLHDIGYSKIPEDKRKTHWLEEVKKEHMVLGAKIARDILEKVNFPEEKIPRVVEIVATHDNPEIGLPLETPEQKTLKEADILWMATEEAFWLDVKRRRKIKPMDWLNILEKRFTKEKEYCGYLRSNFSKRLTKEFIEGMRKKLSTGN